MLRSLRHHHDRDSSSAQIRRADSPDWNCHHHSNGVGSNYWGRDQHQLALAMDILVQVSVSRPHLFSPGRERENKMRTSFTTWETPDSPSRCSVPIGLVTLVLALVVIPNGLPYHGRLERNPFHDTTPGVAFSRLDIPGFVLLMLATLSFTAGFQEADSAFAWDSAYVISLVVGSVVLWAGLLLWERHVTQSDKIREPVLPWRFFTSRGMVGIIL